MPHAWYTMPHSLCPIPHAPYTTNPRRLHSPRVVVLPHVPYLLGLGLVLGSGLGLGLEQVFERRSGDRTRVDGFCDFEKVPPDQLCPSAESGLGLGLWLG